jgi:hypothetical protein
MTATMSRLKLVAKMAGLKLVISREQFIQQHLQHQTKHMKPQVGHMHDTKITDNMTLHARII